MIVGSSVLRQLLSPNHSACGRSNLGQDKRLLLSAIHRTNLEIQQNKSTASLPCRAFSLQIIYSISILTWSSFIAKIKNNLFKAQISNPHPFKRYISFQIIYRIHSLSFSNLQNVEIWIFRLPSFSIVPFFRTSLSHRHRWTGQGGWKHQERAFGRELCSTCARVAGEP